MRIVELVEEEGVGAQQGAAARAAGEGLAPRIAPEGGEVDLARRQRAGGSAEGAAGARAAQAVGGAVDLDQALRARLLVQRVDVLGDQEEVAAAFHLPALQGGEGAVGRIGLRVEQTREAVQEPLPPGHRIAQEEGIRADLGDVAVPDGARIGAAEERQAARGADAGAGHHHDEAGAHPAQGCGEGRLERSFTIESIPFHGAAG